MIDPNELPDYSGTNPKFKMSGELVPVSKVINGYFVLGKGAFYTGGLLVLDSVTGIELTPLIDYEAVVLDSAATGHSGGKPVYTLIKLIKSTGNDLLVDYQYVGGKYVEQVDTLTRLIANMNSRVSGNTLFSQVANRPLTMDVTEEHTHDSRDVTGKDQEIAALTQIAQNLARIAGPADISGVELKVDQLTELTRLNKLDLIKNAGDHLKYDLLNQMTNEVEYFTTVCERIRNRAGSGDELSYPDFDKVFSEDDSNLHFKLPESTRVVCGDLIHRKQHKILVNGIPDGTLVYDKATGTATTFDTPSEAFEGLVKNGDFRNEFSDWLMDGIGVNFIVTDGVMKLTRSTAGEVNDLSQNITGRVVGQTYVCRVVAKSINGLNTIRLTNGIGVDIVTPIKSTCFKEHIIKYVATTGEDTLSIRVQEDLVGASVEVSSISIMKESESVIIDRKALCVTEVFHEDISTLDAVCLFGDVQNEIDSWNGITFERDVVPQTYCAVNSSDTITNGLFVKWSTLPLESKLKFVAEPLNNMYTTNDGRIIQVRSRDRFILGFGSRWLQLSNGDNTGGVTTPSFDTNTLIVPRGTNVVVGDDLHSLTEATSSGLGYYLNSNQIAGESIPLGTSTAVNGDSTYPNESVGYRGKCSVIFNGTVQMLNQGIFSPKNPLGTKLAIDGYPFNVTATKLYSLVDHFNPTKVLSGSGTLASGISGRPDGDVFKFYDAITSNQYHSLRNSSKLMTSEELLSLSINDILGEVRSRGNLPFVKLTKLQISEVSTIDGGTRYRFLDDSGEVYNPTISTSLDVGTYFVHEGSNVSLVPVGLDSIDGVFLGTDLRFTNTNHIIGSDWSVGVVGDILWLVESTDTGIEFNNVPYHTVVGLPSVIDGMDDLTDGWYGSFCPDLPTGVERTFTFRNRVMSYSLGYIAPTAGGWSFNNKLWETPLLSPANAVVENVSSGGVRLHINVVRGKGYITSNTDEFHSGLLGLYADFNNDAYEPTQSGGVLAEQLMDFPLTNTGDNVSSLNIPIYGHTLVNGHLDTTVPSSPKHLDLHLGNPVGGVDGIKAASYITTKQGQPYLQWIYNGLVFDNDNWGDTGKLSIDDSRIMISDANANYVISGQKVSKDPLPYFIK